MKGTKIKRTEWGWILESKSGFKIDVFPTRYGEPWIELRKRKLKTQKEVAEFCDLMIEAIDLAHLPHNCECGERVAFPGALCCEDCGK